MAVERTTAFFFLIYKYIWFFFAFKFIGMPTAVHWMSLKSFGSEGHYQICQRPSEKSLNWVFSCENGGAPWRWECVTLVFECSTNDPVCV